MIFRCFFLIALSTVISQAAESRLVNVSVRSVAGTGAETLIVGFSIGGSGAKPILLRGIGPTLIPFGVPNTVANPQLRLYSGFEEINQNDDWGGTAALTSAFVAVGAFPLPTSSGDSALLQTLQPGSYSAHLDAGGSPGVALVECYDADPGATSGTAYITNLSARSVAGTGSSVLSVGFVIAGTTPKTVLVRGIGPTLGLFGVKGALLNTRLQLFDSAGSQIADNDDWYNPVTPPSVFIAAGAFQLSAGSRDSVLFLGLPPGTYTAQVSGISNTTGTALIEVYEVNNSPVPVFTLQPVVNIAAGPPADPGNGTLTTGTDANPSVIVQTAPVYPLELRVASITGQAYVDFWVKTDGRVANAVAIRATDIRFASSAVAAVQSWIFVPGRRNGTLALTHMQVPIVFAMDGG